MKRILLTSILSFFTVYLSHVHGSVTYNTPQEKEAAIHIQTGIHYIKIGDIDEAIEAFKKAIEVFPDADEAYYNLGLAYMDKGDFASAAKSFEKIYPKAPEDIGLNFNYGYTLLQLKRYSDAIPKLEKVLKANPDDRELEELINKARRAMKGD